MNMKSSTLLMLLAAVVQWIDGEFLGCFEDNDIRLMSGFNMYLDDANTPARCSYVCQQLQFRYAGVEYSTQCYCSEERPYERMRRNLNECYMPCPFGGEICGGGLRLSVYSLDANIHPTTEPGEYIGCYLESNKDRTLNNYQVTSVEINNPKTCVHTCTALGYMYAGVEPNDLCFCGNTRPADGRKAEESECNVVCSAPSTEICGGNDRISVYRTSVNANAESVVTVSDERLKRNAIGCFEDSAQRILPEYFSRLDVTNSPKNCLYLCQQFRFKYAGVHNGTDCFCGNALPSPSRRRNDNECQVSCPNSMDRCGGQMRTYVYSTQMFQNGFQSGLRTAEHSFMKHFLRVPVDDKIEKLNVNS